VSEFGHTLHFNKQGIAICQESGDQYQLIDNRVSRN
jgi:UDP-2-acetamido-3-amino-2,3-dideoxy-glucuronate N-acetyltransferase